MTLSNLRTNISDDERRRIRSDRRYLELALEEAGNLLRNPPRIEGDACHCPFHHDERKSGSIFQPAGNGSGDWLFKCHSCGDGFLTNTGWNNLDTQSPKDTGDAIAVLRCASKQTGQSMDFVKACSWLLNAHSQKCTTPAITIPYAPPPPMAAQVPRDAVKRAEEEAASAHDELVGRKDLLQRLWNERAVDEATARGFKIGYMCDSAGREWWVFPIHGPDGQFMAQKRHAADGRSPKSQWYPIGAKSGKPLFPVDLSNDGAVWLCPGELKALAVIGLDLPAIGWTCGESVSTLPPSITKSLCGRQVAIAADNDDTGRAWASSVQKQLQRAGSDSRVVALGVTDTGGDIGDWIVQRLMQQNSDPGLVRTELRQAFEVSAEAAQAPMDGPQEGSDVADDEVVTSTACASKIQYIGDVWRDKTTWKKVQRVRTHISTLDGILNGGYVTGGVHLLVGKPGNCKTQLAVQIAVNAALNNTPVGFVSLEMDRYEVSRLALSQLSGVSRIRVDNGLNNLSDKQAARNIHDVIRNSGGMPFQLIDGEDELRGFTRSDVDRTIARGVREWDWKLVVLDHLGELAPTDSDTSAQPLQSDKANIGALRAVAKRHNVVLIVVAPLRKATRFSGASVGRYDLDDVLGSANIGYAVRSCAVVTARHGEQFEPSFVLVQLLKNRNGPLPEKTLELEWKPACGRISDQKPLASESGDVENDLLEKIKAISHSGEVLKAIADSVSKQ